MELEKLPKEKYVKLDFTLREYEYFCKECMFTEIQEKILKLRIKGKSLVQISMETNISTATVSREIAKIKKKILKVIWATKSGSFFLTFFW